MHSLGRVKRFYSLDICRGIAALGVVFWHWKHFFYSPGNPLRFDDARFPLYDWLFVFYTKGWLAVDLFFTLSGFVFFWLYSFRVHEMNISLREFLLLRFSRLYPLHFITLVIVAVGQSWMLKNTGSYFIYGNNNEYHFLLNCLFASSWGFEKGYSFNGPSWSISVEFLLYVIFFFYARVFNVNVLALVFISLAGFFMHENPVGRGVGCFFWGGCVFWIYQKSIASSHFGFIARWMAILMICAWVTSLVIVRQQYDVALFVVEEIPSLLQYYVFLGWFISKIYVIWPIVVLFPVTILSLALAETARGTLGRSFSFVGDISYSSYMLHFPIQLLIYVFVGGAQDNHLFYSFWFMVAFLVVLISVSIASYKMLEMPMQMYLVGHAKPIIHYRSVA